ncbi:DsbA family protein [Neptunicoccus sediminis]|uniref:DsbA family protein n=1 Tax=Neptunicoccus sediminis TaxID=1892596 RepID=UPI00084605D4|nr:DsbA family protein [Neptunicoccus sediminis]
MITRRTALATLAATTLPGSFTFAQEETLTVPDMRLGNELAKVTVTEYASFTCPHCASFHANTYPQLKANYIDTDKINFVYREVYFDRFGLWGAMIARCDPAKFFGIADMLYKRQAEWSRAGEPAAIVGEMRKIGKIAGLSDEQLDACLNDQKMAEAMVARFQETSTADEVNSTPTLLVNGTKYGNLPYSELAEIIDAELGS